MPFGNAMGHTWLAVANANASKPVFSCCVNHSSFAWRSLATQVRADSNWPEFESRLQTEDPVTPDECRFWFNVKTISLLCGTEISAAHSFMPNESWKHANKRLFTADLRGFNTLNLIATRLQSMS